MVFENSKLEKGARAGGKNNFFISFVFDSLKFNFFVPMSTKLIDVPYPSACSNVSRQRFQNGHSIQDMHKAMRQYSTAPAGCRRAFGI